MKKIIINCLMGLGAVIYIAGCYAGGVSYGSYWLKLNEKL